MLFTRQDPRASDQGVTAEVSGPGESWLELVLSLVSSPHHGWALGNKAQIRLIREGLKQMAVY